jgi:hypothetical protein
MNILEGGGLARTGRGNQYDKAVVERGRLSNSFYDSVGEWFRHERSPFAPGSLSLDPPEFTHSSTSFLLNFQSRMILVRHLPFTDPLGCRIPLDAKMVSNLIYGEPSVFHHATPVMFGLIGCLTATSFSWLIDVPRSSLRRLHPNKIGQTGFPYISLRSIAKRFVWLFSVFDRVEPSQGFRDQDTIKRFAFGPLLH